MTSSVILYIWRHFDIQLGYYYAPSQFFYTVGHQWAVTAVSVTASLLGASELFSVSSWTQQYCNLDDADFSTDF